MRGYFAIGIESGKNPSNLGTLWRSAQAFGASYIFTIEHRYSHQVTDTCKTPRNVPLIFYPSYDDFAVTLPMGAKLVGIEITDNAKPLSNFCHPQRAIYLLGSEGRGLSQNIMECCDHIVYIPAKPCLNVAVAGSIVMYDRIQKGSYRVQESLR